MLLDDFVNSKTYRRIAANVCLGHELRDDLHAETILVIHEKNFDLSAILNPVHFFSAVCWQTWHSNKFRKKYFSKEVLYSEQTEAWAGNKAFQPEPAAFPSIDPIIEYIKEDPKTDLEYYEKNLLRLYLELGDCKAVHRKTGIPYRTVANDIHTIKQRFIKQHNDQNSDSMQHTAPYRAELSPSARSIHENIRPPRVPG